MALLQIVFVILFAGGAIAAHDGIIFPSGRTGGRTSAYLAASVALPVNLTNAISRGSEAFSLDLFQV